MPRSSLWKVSFAIVLVLLLAAPAARAAQPRKSLESAVETGRSWGLLGQVWDLLVRTWTKNGFELDPSGRWQPDAGTSSAACDNGFELDPDGRCIG